MHTSSLFFSIILSRRGIEMGYEKQNNNKKMKNE